MRIPTRLCQLALRYGTDKGPLGPNGRTDGSGHNYTPTYSQYFEHLVSEEVKLLEIGVLGGASLKMWNDYFLEGEIFGIDKWQPRISEQDEQTIRESLEREGISVMQADQHNREDLSRVVEEYGPSFDIIIDDGSHWNDDIRISLGYFFRHLKPGGIYIVEDCLWGDVKNNMPKNQTEEMLKAHPVRPPNVGVLANAWNQTKSFKCPVMLESEIKYLCENVDTWDVLHGGKLNVLKKKG
tara:strand:+ start:1635 stop:2351 length:717 start_codon:yes stop_codon:yes gene_type:complete